jgi:hypothetical protein
MKCGVGLDILRTFAEFAPDNILFGELTPLARHRIRTIHPDVNTLVAQRKYVYENSENMEAIPPTSGQLHRRRRRLGIARRALASSDMHAIVSSIASDHTAAVKSLVELRSGVDLDADVLEEAWPETERVVKNSLYDREIFPHRVQTIVHGIGGVCIIVSTPVSSSSYRTDYLIDYIGVSPWVCTYESIDESLDGTIELALVISEMFGPKTLKCDHVQWRWDFDLFMHVIE